MYLLHSIMEWGFSIFVLGLEVAMLSFYHEPDNIQFVIPDDEKQKSNIVLLLLSQSDYKGCVVYSKLAVQIQLL